MTSVGRRGGARQTPPPQYDPYAPQLGQLSERIHRLLTERECGIFDRGLADYHRRRSVKAFVECLSIVLNTNQKRQLLLPIRDTYVKPSDFNRFNELAVNYNLAASLSRKKKDQDKASTTSGVQKVEVKRDSNGEWGFSIRGGSEHGIGIFVSWVDPGSSAEKNGLQIGDQILKANDTSFEEISHYDAIQTMKSFKKLRLWVLPHGRVPSTRMAQKIYKWVDPEGRPASPPADVQLLSEYPNQRHRTGGQKVLNEADERKVNILVEPGKELGISIRGGVEHGLGVYISAVEQGSAGKQYGLKVGDQILEVNGINFSSILHSEAVNVLRAQPSMVMKIKDVGKLPHSRVTTYGDTQWHSTATLPAKNSQTQYQESGRSSPIFQHGAGTQLVFKKQETKQQTRGMMSDVARSILTDQEFSTFCYYINQYDHHQLSVEDLVTPLLHLLDTPEKLQILSDVRAVIRPMDLNRFSDLTVHTEIAAKQARKGAEHQAKIALGSGVGLHSEPRTPAAYNQYSLTDREQNVDVDAYLQADISLESEDTTLTPTNYEDESGRDIIPQRLRSAPRTNEAFRAPPPPSSPPQHSTPDVPDQNAMLESRMKERRKYVLPQGSDSILDSEDGWNETSLSSIHSKPTFKAKDSLRPRNDDDDVDGSVSVSDIEAAVRKETEAMLRKEFEEKQLRIAEEERQKLLLEQQENEQRLQAEKEAMQRQFNEMKEQAKRELEEKLRAEAEERFQLEIQEREHKLAEEHAKRLREEKQREDMAIQQQMQEIEERTRQELEEKIWKEAAEHMKQEYEAQMQQQKEKFAREVSKKSRVDASVLEQVETRLRDQMEKKYQKQYEEKMQQEMEKKRKQDEEERRRREGEQIARQNAETARLEAEEQARIELEERISQEAESKARAQYEMRLQRETEEKVRLAEEIKARQAAEQRRDQSRKEAQELTGHQEDEKPAAIAREATARPRGEATPADVASPQRKKELERKELERKREENIRRREEERRQKELQSQQKPRQDAGQEHEKRQQEARRQQEEERRQQEEKRRQQEEKRRQQAAERQHEEQERRREEEEERQREELRQQEEAMHQQEEEQRREEEQQREEERLQLEEKKKKEKQRRAAALGVHREPVNFGDGKGNRMRNKQKLIEEERLKAEEKLRRRIERNKEKKPDTTVPPVQAVAPQRTGKSFAGYDNLVGEILTVTVTKVCKKLGIAIDGGASSKQKEVIIREISPGGCAAQTGTGLCVNQQILQVNGTSFKGLKHHDVVLTIKNAFEGPLNKKIEFVVLDIEQ